MLPIRTVISFGWNANLDAVYDNWVIEPPGKLFTRPVPNPTRVLSGKCVMNLDKRFHKERA